MLRRSWGGSGRRLGRLVVPLAMVALAVGACGSSTPANTDPYDLAVKAMHAQMDQVKVQLGLKTSGSSNDMSIDPGAIALVLDTKATKASFHLSLPVSALGSDAAQLKALGVTGDTLDLDVLYDGQALYAKSPLATTLVPLLFAQSGQTITGDLTGWLKLGTAADFEALVAGIGGTLIPSPAPGASASPGLTDLDAAQLKTELEGSGVVLTYAGTEQRNGVDSAHLTATIDGQKLASSPMAKELPVAQLGQVEALASGGTLTADIWLDRSSNRLNELDLHITGKDSSKTDLTVLVSVPDSTAFDAPATSTDVPVAPLLSTLLKSFGGLLLP